MSTTIRTQATQSVSPSNGNSGSTANRFLSSVTGYVKAAPPYVFGGGHGGPQQGYGSVDCSGMVIQSLYKAGVKNPENLVNTTTMPGQPISRDQLQPGDLLYKHGSGAGGHVAVYIGNGMIAESYQTGLPPRVRKLGQPDEFTDFRRILDKTGDPVSTSGISVGAANNGGGGGSDSVGGNIGSGGGQTSTLSLPPGGAPFHDFIADENQREGNGGASVAPSGAGSAAASAGPSGPPPSGNLKQWIDEAVKVLEGMGIPLDKINVSAIATIIQHESGGDPHAVNNWDSNAAAGHPSKGLMQTIESTFSAYAAPGHHDIFNPIDNIVAGVRYAISRYGSLNNVPGVKNVANGGSYVGY